MIQRVTALAQAVAADIKALYAGKAEKEHTHTAAQVSGLGTAATKDVVQATGTSTEDVMSQKAVTDNLDSLGVELGTLRQELDKLKLRLPPEIGDEIGGGFYIGDITIPDGDDAGTYMVIMAGKEGEAGGKWKLTETSTENTASSDNGKSNTLAMVTGDISKHPAGERCVNYRGGGFDDWYLPAIDELVLAWDNMALLEDLKMGDYTIWSSTQRSDYMSHILRFSSGSKSTDRKSRVQRVRPVRRIKKQ